MDPTIARDRLLWLEARGIGIAIKARQLQRRLARVALVDADDLAREIAALAVVARVREDEVAIWRVELEPPTPTPTPTPPRPVPMPAPLRRWWWLW